MQKLIIQRTALSPEIHFSPDENIFVISGISSPEDVRSLYYPVIDWIKNLIDDQIKTEIKIFNSKNPLKLKIDLDYFNSSSAKFIYDIFYELKRLTQNNIPVVIEWHYEKEDIDMKEAGEDIALLAEMEFTYISK